jgi:hypothetical protein
VVVNRLRAGHTLLTHGYLMDNTVPDVAPVCELCNNDTLTVKHVFLHCEEVEEHRQNSFSCCRVGQTANMDKLIGDDSSIGEVINFAKAINMYCNV